ncbi:hypothetical protein FKG94_09760 [Exilibacterium tricleocarpae]|uniref:Cell division inhibitor SulA n=1 Tax=Exilibacterium tricleocarpae TaxID=2591008 RepID=A0A545TVX2_9GAMM|nr:SulA-like leucine-rich domain-containing protein [Exilibacterium tricleocarpae]TQV81366.1 hypothetical protein FKG94_09760 [Exilibacterium tricleocarpae]
MRYGATATATAYQQPRRPQPAPTPSGVTEVVLSGESPAQLQLILPMLAHMSHLDDYRWITWIGDHRLDRRQLDAYGVDSRKLRLVYPPRAEDVLWITWDALAAGNSHTVIASPGKISEAHFRRLDEAAERGDARGIMLRLR